MDFMARSGCASPPQLLSRRVSAPLSKSDTDNYDSLTWFAMLSTWSQKNLALKWKSQVANSSCCSSLSHWTTNQYLPGQWRFFTCLEKNRWLTCFDNLVPRVLYNLCQHVFFPATDMRGALLTCYAPFWPEMTEMSVTSRLQPLPALLK